MKSSLKLLVGVVLIILTPELKGQGTAFTYQGRLNDGASPATGVYDVKFAIYDAAMSGAAVSSALTNTAIGVTNGLFTTTLDFGNVFNGVNRWLEIAVRTNGVAPFVTLSPRQLLTPAPYAVYAANAGTAITATTANNVGSLNSANIAQLNVLGNSSQATGSPVVTSGFITGANVTYGGSGYVTPPFVTVSDSTGSNAVITANISGGAVVSFNVLNAGHGYSSGATLIVGLPPSTASQTFSGINNFSGVNTMTNPNNTFVGSFYGNGAGLTNVPASGVAAWQIVPGTTLQAQPNAGYLLTNNSQVTVALPVAPNLGDVVRVSGGGAGGWKLTPNAGQTIFMEDVLGVGWKQRSPESGVSAIASSADGTKLVAGGYEVQIYASSDSGATWTVQTNSPTKTWDAIASSADGTKLVAVGRTSPSPSSTLYASTDSGTMWTARATVTNAQFICSSADGVKLAAIFDGRIHTSPNSGVTWVSQNRTNCYLLASSADGTKLVTAVFSETSTTLYTSTDSGMSWEPRATTPAGYWYSVCSSADGTKLAAVGDGQVYTSSDSGVSWVAQINILNAAAIASSADGAKLIIGCDGGPIHISNDSGFTWTPQIASPVADFVISSTDGRRLIAKRGASYLYTYLSQATSSVSGYLLGGPKTAAELQYIGGGQFMLIDRVGSLRVY